ncbi:hypothetical protein Y032_0098g3129 [Ancylostoma ceylanicum]|nr:hypothetical protein Y032_0098g3129 [Ancylostoma ceylanicum]
MKYLLVFLFVTVASDLVEILFLWRICDMKNLSDNKEAAAERCRDSCRKQNCGRGVCKVFKTDGNVCECTDCTRGGAIKGKERS